MKLEDGRLVFDPIRCFDCYAEVVAWDDEQHEAEALRQFKVKSTKRMKNPERERLFKARNRGTGHWYKKEDPKAKRRVQKQFRKKMKTATHLPGAKEYHTYGWETW